MINPAPTSLFESVTDYTLKFCDADSHTRYYKVVCGDNQVELDAVEDGSIDLVLTSPPYFQQRIYSTEGGVGQEADVGDYLDSILRVVQRITKKVKPTGNIVYNLGDKIVNRGYGLIPHRFAVRAVDELGLRLVNDITWVKSNPTPHQYPRRLTSSTEPFFHFAMGDGYYFDRDAYLPLEKSHRSSKRARPRKGNNYREQIDATSELTPGEKVLAHSALNDVVAEVERGEIYDFRMKIRGVHSEPYGGNQGGRKIRLERDGFTIIRMSGNRMKRDIIESSVETLRGVKHPAVFPVGVVRELVRLLCPVGGLVFDPYAGSGTTMVAAFKENRSSVGMEISADYCDIAVTRLIDACGRATVPPAHT